MLGYLKTLFYHGQSMTIKNNPPPATVTGNNMTEYTPDNRRSIIIWQENEDCIGEQALLIQSYRGLFCINQNGQSININYETKKELIAAIKAIQEPE